MNGARVGPGGEPAGTSEGRTASRSRRTVLLALILVVAAGLRAVPLRHGWPRGYVPDAHVVKNALGMARDRDPVPPAGKYSSYPYLLAYLLVPVYAARYGVGLATGEWSDAAEFGDHVLLHPEGVHGLARAMVALLGVLTVWVVYRAARAAGLRAGALVAAWLLATGLLHVQLSVHERPWVPLGLFIALAAWMAVRHARGGRTRDLALSAVAAGLAFATHQAGLLALGLPVLAFWLGPPGWSRRELGRRAATAGLGLALFALVSLAFGHPYLLVYGGAEAVAGGELASREGDLVIGGQAARFGFRWESFEHLSRALVGYDPVLVALALAGVAAGLLRRSLRAVTLWTLAWAGFFLFHENDHVRYLTPALALACLPAGLAAERTMARPAGRIALALVLVLPLVQAARLAWLLAREDTRAEAERALYELPIGARVAIDRYGPDVDLTVDALDRLADMRARRGEVLYARERRRREVLQEGPREGLEYGIDGLPLEDLFAYDEPTRQVALHPGLESFGRSPSEALERMGVTHVLVVRRTIDASPVFLAEVAAGSEPLVVIDPARGRQAEAALPTELDFPLTALWRVERPGPWMALYDLR